MIWPQCSRLHAKLKRIREILYPLHEFTKQLEHKETPTISKLLPFLCVGIHKIESNALMDTDVGVAFNEKAFPH